MDILYLEPSAVRIIENLSIYFMKIIILCLLCGFLCLGCADKEEGSFTITGQMKGLSDGMVRLYTYPPSNLLLDSCRIKDGKYYLKGKIEEAQLCLLYFESRAVQ